MRIVILCKVISVDALWKNCPGCVFRDNKGYLTIKGASNDSGTSRYEWEKEISLQEAEELMNCVSLG